MICSSFVYHKNINLNINCTSLIFTDKRSNASIKHHRPASQIAYINKIPAYNSDTASCHDVSARCRSMAAETR